MRTDLRDILSGLEAGNIQTVGVMQVIPLVYQTDSAVTDMFSPPSGLKINTRSYGQLTFENNSNRATIVPLGASFITKQAAQDHATGKMTVVPARSRANDDGAMCIQASQGGYIHGEEGANMSFLPQTLRERAYQVRAQLSYSKLWDRISRLNIETGQRDNGHLSVFMDRFKEQLDLFVAEFENVPKQVGAIFLIGGAVMGVERVPNEEFWSFVSYPLIRDCYGSMAVYALKTGKVDGVPSTRVPLVGFMPPSPVNTLEQLRIALERCNDVQSERAKVIVRGISQELVDTALEMENDSMKLFSMDGSRYNGQYLQVDGRHVYASIIRTDAENCSDAQPFSL